MILFAGEGELLVFLVHLDVAAAGDTAGAHAARHNGSVGGLTAAHRQDALCILHALDVLGRGLKTHQNDLFARLAALGSLFGGEHDLTGSSTGGSGNTLADRHSLLQRSRVELRMQQHVEGFCVDLHQRFFLGDHALVDEVARDFDSSGSGTLAVTGLQHIELLVLNGELHVLHVAIVIFQRLANAEELLVNFRQHFLHLRDRHRGAHAGDNVFALCVHQEFAHETLFAGGGVTGERNAGAGGVAHVAERHHLDVDGSTPGVGDVMIHTVDVGTRVVPGTEHSLDRLEELFLRIVREVLAELILILSLELTGECLQVVSGQLDVISDALLFFHLVDELLKVFLADFHNDVGEHLDETAIAVPSPARIAGFRGNDLNDLLVQTEVQDGVHHAGHGSTGAGTDGNEERILHVAELFAGDFFHLGDVFHDLRLDLVIDPTTVLIVLRAGFGGNGEALGHRQTDLGHFRQVGALAAEQLTHLRVAFGEEINVLVTHKSTS